MSQIFLYTDAAKMTDATVALLRKNGYIPIKVDAVDAVRFMPSPIPEADLSVISRAALEAVRDCGYSSVQADFGKRVAAALAKDHANSR